MDQIDPQPTPPNAARSRRDARGVRDPGGPRGATWSWLAIVAIVGFLVALHTLPAPAETGAADEPSPTGGVLKLISRYAVGSVELSRSVMSEEALDELIDGLLPQLRDASATRDEFLRAALVAAALYRPDAAREFLERALRTEDDNDEDESADEDEEATALPEYLVADAARLQRLIERGPGALTQDDRDALVDHHAWFAEVALTRGLPASDPARIDAVAPGTRLVTVIVTLLFAATGALVIGICLLAWALVRSATGMFRWRYAPPAPGGSVYIETFALFLVGFLIVGAVSDAVLMTTGQNVQSLAVWLLLPLLLWPVVRGARRIEAKYALGWHRGAGFGREIGAGLIGYLAGLPIVAIGLLCAILLSALVAKFSQDGPGTPSHPVVHQAEIKTIWDAVPIYLLACVWAPVVEESMFRGALYHHLRGRIGAAVGGLISGLIFAAIHPQGILFIPPLMALGFVFALMREWRGSLIAPMVAHALHNSILVSILIVAMS